MFQVYYCICIWIYVTWFWFHKVSFTVKRLPRMSIDMLDIGLMTAADTKIIGTLQLGWIYSMYEMGMSLWQMRKEYYVGDVKCPPWVNVINTRTPWRDYFGMLGTFWTLDLFDIFRALGDEILEFLVRFVLANFFWEVWNPVTSSTTIDKSSCFFAFPTVINFITLNHEMKLASPTLHLLFFRYSDPFYIHMQRWVFLNSRLDMGI